MLKNVLAIEYDGSDAYALVISFEVQDRKFELAAAAKAAAEDYCRTLDGMEEYKSNRGCYNWGDFVSIPTEFCEKHGFSIVKDTRIDEVVDLNEPLVESIETDRVNTLEQVDIFLKS